MVSAYKQFSWILLMVSATMFSCKQKMMEDNEIGNQGTSATYLEQEKDSIRQELDKQADKLDQKIKKVKSDLVVAKDETKTDLQKKADALEEQREILKLKYLKIEMATEETWGDIKAEINEYIDTLKVHEEQPLSPQHN